MNKPANTSQLDNIQIARRLQEKATELGESIAERLGFTAPPIKPEAVAHSEWPLLLVQTGDYRSRFDGQLEYARAKNRFLLFLNTKYDDPSSTEFHPRTRFSFAHELGHYFIERHRAYLMRGGKAHGSRGEYFSDAVVEREADSFAAGLLMPSRLIRRVVNMNELSPGRIAEIADKFKTSLLSTAIRCVQLSDFPCAVLGIRDARIAWTTLSQAMLKVGCYPLPRAAALPSSAARIWSELTTAPKARYARDGMLTEWFETHERDTLSQILVHTEAQWLSTTGTLLVLVTADEADVDPDDAEQDYGED
jgi:IrrE N-terminal-like domain